jgi:hypothetical protein
VAVILAQAVILVAVILAQAVLLVSQAALVAVILAQAVLLVSQAALVAVILAQAANRIQAFDAFSRLLNHKLGVYKGLMMSLTCLVR